jgi:hypothetical protein
MCLCACVCVCVCSIIYPACNAHAPCCRQWPAPLYNTFPRYLIRNTILEETFIENKMFISIFCITFVSNIFRTKKNWGDIKMYIGLPLTYPLFLSDFHEPWIFSSNFRKILVAGQSEFEPKDCYPQTKSRTISVSVINIFLERSNYEHFLRNGFFKFMPIDWTKLKLYVWYCIIMIFGTKSPLHQKVTN